MMLINEISIEEIVEKKMNIGHRRATLHPFMRPNMSRIKSAFTIFDAKKVLKSLENALIFLQANKDKEIVFLFAKERTRYIKEVIPNNNLYLFKWINGLLSNFEQVYRSIAKVNELREANVFESKREKHQFIRMNEQMSGLTGLTTRPDIIICTDAKAALAAILEAKQCGVTTIAITDSDVNPRMVDYPILGSDDRIEGILFILQQMVTALGLVPNVVQLLQPEKTDLSNEVEQQHSSEIDNV